MNRVQGILKWTYAIRNNPIQTDPAPIVTDPEGEHIGQAYRRYRESAQEQKDM